MSIKDVELSRRLQEIANQLRKVADSLQSLVNEISGEKTVSEASKVSLEEQLKGELKDNVQHNDFSTTPNEIRIRPKRFLGTDVFKTIADASRKHGGRWDGWQRCFIIPLRK